MSTWTFICAFVCEVDQERTFREAVDASENELSEMRALLGSRQIELSKREDAFKQTEAEAERRWLAMTHSVSAKARPEDLSV